MYVVLIFKLKSYRLYILTSAARNKKHFRSGNGLRVGVKETKT